MKKLFTLLFLCLFAMGAYAQENVVKLSLGSAFAGNINLGYERVLSENQSANVWVGFLVPRGIPTIIDDVTGTSKISGFSIIPEYRFYLSKSKEAPAGFYVAPYLPYCRYSFNYTETLGTYDTKAKGSFGSIGLGGQLGVQWIISDAVSIDWYFFGLSLNRNTVNIRYTSEDPNTNYETLEQDIQTSVEDFPLFGNRLKTESGTDFVEAKAPYIFPGFRTGISIGYAF